jgi:hypothetical protein
LAIIRLGKGRGARNYGWHIRPSRDINQDHSTARLDK